MTDSPAIDQSFPDTDLLYQRDSYLRSFEAVVLAADPESRAIMLDRTALFPGGGGQPNDTGRVRRAEGHVVWRISAMKKQGQAVQHIVDGDDQLPAIGDTLKCEIDWPTRYRLMRTHTAMHALCGTIFRDYGSLVTGCNMGPDKARMDFEMEEFTPARVAEIERRVNEELAKGRSVNVQILPRAEAFAIPDLIRTKINLLPEGIAEIRTVEIVGLDLQADGGTHVANTREVGGIKIVGTRSKGKSNKRLEIILTGRDGDEMYGGTE